MSDYNPHHNEFIPNSPVYVPNSPVFIPRSPVYSPSTPPDVNDEKRVPPILGGADLVERLGNLSRLLQQNTPNNNNATRPISNHHVPQQFDYNQRREEYPYQGHIPHPSEHYHYNAHPSPARSRSDYDHYSHSLPPPRSSSYHDYPREQQSYPAHHRANYESNHHPQQLYDYYGNPVSSNQGRPTEDMKRYYDHYDDRERSFAPQYPLPPPSSHGHEFIHPSRRNNISFETRHSPSLSSETNNRDNSAITAHYICASCDHKWISKHPEALANPSKCNKCATRTWAEEAKHRQVDENREEKKRIRNIVVNGWSSITTAAKESRITNTLTNAQNNL